MPFHVEVRSPLHHARAFNLGDGEVRQLLGFWIAGQTFEFGEQEWEPGESKLTILEGKGLDGPDLAFGQGWSNALRSAEDVTRQMVESAEIHAPPPPVVEVEADSVEAAAAAIASGSSPSAVEWSAARGRIDGRDPEVAAVILVVKRSGPEASRS
jgi:hypothetical protein